MTFLAPAFLAGLIAIGLPLWLHRLSSTNPNRQTFSSLMFLEAGEPRRVLAKKLQYLLLLAMRIALLVLLALAFAQPAWFRTPGAAGAGEDAQLHLIVVDSSASMSHGERWDRAQQAADDIVDAMTGDDRGQVVAAGRIAELVTEATADRAALRQGIGTLRPTAFRVDYGRLTRALDGVLRDAELPVVLHFVTDAQESAMPTRFAELAPRTPAALEIHNVADEGDANWAVESFGGSPLTGELEASVRSFAGEPAERTVRLELNGSVVDERRVSLTPGGRSDVAFDPLELRPGPNRVAVSIEPGDDLAVDDSRFLAMKRPEPRDVLIVSAGGARGGGDVFVGAALETLDALAIESSSIAVTALRDETLADYSFAVVTDAGLLSEDDAARLRDYVEAGGGLLLALGQRSSGLNLVPVTGQTVQTGAGMSMRGEEFESIGEVDVSHPALRGVDELRSGKFFRYVQLQPSPEDNVLARLDGGAPLLVESRVGDGRALVYASTLDRQWNDLPVQPVFVPFIAGLANHLLGGAGFSAEAELGTTLAVRAMGMQGGQIFDPDGEPALGLGGGAGDVLLDRVGFYEVVGGGRTEVVAVNPDPLEADIAAVDEATIERWQGLGFTEDQAVQSASGGETASVPVSLAPWLLFVLVAAVLMESLLGNWHLRVRRGIAT